MSEDTPSVPRKFNLVPSPPDPRDFMLKLAPHGAAIPSADINLVVPFQFDQGQHGTCFANAASNNIGYLEAQQGVKMPLANSRDFIYYNAIPDKTKDSGVSLRSGIKSLNQYGVVVETLWPYDDQHFLVAPPQSLYALAKGHLVLKYERIIPSPATALAALQAKHVLVIGMAVYSSFEAAQPAKDGIIPYPTASDQLLGGHAVLITGVKKIGDNWYWQFKNSWGLDWGDKGTGYLPWEYLNYKLVFDIFALTLLSEPKAT